MDDFPWSGLVLCEPISILDCGPLFRRSTNSNPKPNPALTLITLNLMLPTITLRTLSLTLTLTFGIIDHRTFGIVGQYRILTLVVG